ncbi:serine hydrolase [Marinilactibacillus kalidii]|uniref:serine hydrolase n=1 Tax=Marinilactibacillus kalidii TaxID=2820274 RepID=UPI001FC8FCC2|nr:serine hydrolase [Marinilactibacillus kalidii]
MKSMKQSVEKIVLSGLTASLLMPVLSSANQVVHAAPQAPGINAEAALVVDFDTNQVLLNQNADGQRGIASMTKMLVEYILFQEIEAGNVNWDTETTISEYAHRISQNYELSNVPLRQGENYTIEELYQAMAIYSANGATIAIAEQLAGSEPELVDRMRELIESWGVTEFELYNATGLSNSYLEENIYPGSTAENENIMSARGIATVASHLLKDYPEVLNTSSIPSMVFREGTSDAIQMSNWNWMLKGLIHERPNVDGLKTGTTPFAGATFTGTAEQDGRRIITVVMGAGDGVENRAQRFDETEKLMDYGFDKWTATTIMEENTVLEDVEPLTVRNGEVDQVDMMTAASADYILPEGVSEDDVEWTFVPDEEVIGQDSTLEAPVEKGQSVGTLTLSYEGDDLGFLDGSDHQTIPVVTSKAVERAGFFSVAGTWISEFFSGLMNRF